MKEISADELRRMEAAGEHLMVLDVREPYEVEEISMGGANLPMSQLLDRLAEIPRDIAVVVHCNSGSRSCAVVDTLSSRYGFTNLINLRGGIQAWRAGVEASQQHG